MILVKIYLTQFIVICLTRNNC